MTFEISTDDFGEEGPAFAELFRRLDEEFDLSKPSAECEAVLSEIAAEFYNLLGATDVAFDENEHDRDAPELKHGMLTGLAFVMGLGIFIKGKIQNASGIVGTETSKLEIERQLELFRPKLQSLHDYLNLHADERHLQIADMLQSVLGGRTP